MRIDDAEHSLRDYLASAGVRPGHDNATTVLAAMMDWYVLERAQDAAPLDEDGDMLLFQWGTHDWCAGPEFEYGLTRQLIIADEEADDGIIQLALTYRYPISAETIELRSGNRWCRSPAELAAFRREIDAHPASVVILAIEPSGVSIQAEVAG